MRSPAAAAVRISGEPKFGRDGQIYSFTTEHLRGYLPLLCRRGSSVLTVCGSGDQILNCALLGARHVAGFDLNIRALYWAELKIAAARRLGMTEFLEFFLLEEGCGGGKKSAALGYDRFLALAPDLSPACREFFERRYLDCRGCGAALRASPLFNLRHDVNFLKIRGNSYLQDPESFGELQDRLAGCSWRLFTACVTDVAVRLNERYDLILLSNIADYAGGLFADDELCLGRFARRVIGPLGRHLNRGGIIAAAYIYARRCGKCARRENHGRIDDPGLRTGALRLPGFSYSELSFPGMIAGEDDAVILLQKE